MSPALSPQLRELITRRRTQPRNILSFLFGMTTLIFGGIVVLAIALIDSGELVLAMALVAVGLVIAVGAMVAVFLRAGTNPAGLMLTNVSGPEYESIHRTLTLGNSSEGERREVVEAAGEDVIIAGVVSEMEESPPQQRTTEPEDANE